jgi:hypothetical protein
MFYLGGYFFLVARERRQRAPLSLPAACRPAPIATTASVTFRAVVHEDLTELAWFSSRFQAEGTKGLFVPRNHC